MSSTFPKKNHNACFICLQTTAKNPNISLHRFPTDEYQRSLWLEACGLVEKDYKSSRRVCSLHFTEDSFNTHNVRKCLYPGSVPSIFFNNSDVAKKSKTYESKSPDDNYKEHRKRKSRSLVRVNEPRSREKSPFCPSTMFRYDAPFNDKYPTKWVCRLCLACMLSENTALRHFVSCKLVSTMNKEISDSDEEDPKAWHTPKLQTILRFIERDSNSDNDSDTS